MKRVECRELFLLATVATATVAVADTPAAVVVTEGKEAAEDADEREHSDDGNDDSGATEDVGVRSTDDDDANENGDRVASHGESEDSPPPLMVSTVVAKGSGNEVATILGSSTDRGSLE